jgi:hypothetical protein
METYHAIIGNIGYMKTEAENDDLARAWFAVHMHHQGEGLYHRWRDSGMRVSIFKRGLIANDERKNRWMK